MPPGHHRALPTDDTHSFNMPATVFALTAVDRFGSLVLPVRCTHCSPQPAHYGFGCSAGLTCRTWLVLNKFCVDWHGFCKQHFYRRCRAVVTYHGRSRTDGTAGLPLYNHAASPSPGDIPPTRTMPATLPSYRQLYTTAVRARFDYDSWTVVLYLQRSVASLYSPGQHWMPLCPRWTAAQPCPHTVPALLHRCLRAVLPSLRVTAPF